MPLLQAFQSKYFLDLGEQRQEPLVYNFLVLCFKTYSHNYIYGLKLPKKKTFVPLIITLPKPNA